MTISRWILRIRNVSNESCRENQNAHFLFSMFSWKSCRLWDNVETCGGVGEAAYGNAARDAYGYWRASTRPDPRANKEKYVKLTAFPRQQWFRERASLLRYTYTACRVFLFACDLPFSSIYLCRPPHPSQTLLLMKQINFISTFCIYTQIAVTRSNVKAVQQQHYVCRFSVTFVSFLNLS